MTKSTTPAEGRNGPQGRQWAGDWLGGRGDASCEENCVSVLRLSRDAKPLVFKLDARKGALHLNNEAITFSVVGAIGKRVYNGNNFVRAYGVNTGIVGLNKAERLAEQESRLGLL